MHRKDKSKKDWNSLDWQDWIDESFRMYQLALQNPIALRVDMWREEYERRTQELKQREAA